MSNTNIWRRLRNSWTAGYEWEDARFTGADTVSVRGFTVRAPNSLSIEFDHTPTPVHAFGMYLSDHKNARVSGAVRIELEVHTKPNNYHYALDDASFFGVVSSHRLVRVTLTCPKAMLRVVCVAGQVPKPQTTTTAILVS